MTDCFDAPPVAWRTGWPRDWTHTSHQDLNGICVSSCVSRSWTVGSEGATAAQAVVASMSSSSTPATCNWLCFLGSQQVGTATMTVAWWPGRTRAGAYRWLPNSQIFPFAPCLTRWPPSSVGPTTVVEVLIRSFRPISGEGTESATMSWTGKDTSPTTTVASFSPYVVISAPVQKIVSGNCFVIISASMAYHQICILSLRGLLFSDGFGHPLWGWHRECPKTYVITAIQERKRRRKTRKPETPPPPKKVIYIYIYIESSILSRHGLDE